MARLFISNEQLDRWSESGKVTLEGDVMNLPAMQRRFHLEGAVYFDCLVEGQDAAGLLGRAKTNAQLEKLGADLLGSSVVIGETVYQCVEGFIGMPTADAPTP